MTKKAMAGEQREYVRFRRSAPLILSLQTYLGLEIGLSTLKTELVFTNSAFKEVIALKGDL